MTIIQKSLRIIDYEGNRIITRETPTLFDEYITELIMHINTNVSVREYKTRSSETEVIGSILEIYNNMGNNEIVLSKINIIANRLLHKEIEAQGRIGRLNTNVQKGSLIQALLFNEDENQHIYLLAKVEHSDFVDDSDFSFKTGFSKDKKTIWKSCLFGLSDPEAVEFNARIYSNTIAKYWCDDFLELDEMMSDESNTVKAFNAIETTLNQNLKGIISRDHTIIRNAIISYFKNNEHIDFPVMVETVLGQYDPVDLDVGKVNSLKEKMLQLPLRKNFDHQFNSVPNVINARIKKIYQVNQGIQLKITDAIDDIENTIVAYRDDDGTKYIKIKTNNDETYERFKH